MSIVKFILSFLVSNPIKEIPVIPAPAPAPTAPKVDLTAALLTSAEAEIEKLKAKILRLEAEEEETLEAIEAERRHFAKQIANSKEEAGHWRWQAENLAAAVNNRGQELLKLQDKVEHLEGQVVMTNNWLGEILNQANRETRRAKIYEALWLCAKGRASSNFRLSVISPELTKEEVAWRYVRQLEQLMAAYDEVDPKPVAKKVAAKPANKRGHRCGTSTPSPRERFHYLNR